MILPDAAAAFIHANTALASPSLLPELTLHTASEITPIWEAGEAALQQSNLPAPFWAFAWPGGQAVARHVLDCPEVATGRRVLDVGAGSGLVAIAAARAGAARVTAADTDPVACAAIGLNAKLNRVRVEIRQDDLIGRDVGRELGIDLVLAGDVFYERPMAEKLLRWFRALAGQGVTVLFGDPGRTYCPATGLAEVACYTVPTSRELEDRTERETFVWRLLP